MVDTVGVTNCEIKFYDFWAWQYTKRNPKILRISAEIEFRSQELVHSGFLAEPWSSDGLLGLIEMNSWMLENETHRTPTLREVKELEEIEELRKALRDCGFDHEELLAEVPTSADLLAMQANGDDICQCGPEFGRAELIGGTSSIKNYGWHDVSILKIKKDMFGEIESGTKCLFCIDFSMPREKLISDFLWLIDKEKCEMRGGDKGGSSCGECNRANKCAVIGSGYTDGIISVIKSRNMVSLSKGKHAPRILGIWLWDYIQEHGGREKRGIIAKAIRAIKTEIKNLSGDIAYYNNSSERVFQHFYNMTEKCIERCEVLSFK